MMGNDSRKHFFVKLNKHWVGGGDWLLTEYLMIYLSHKPSRFYNPLNVGHLGTFLHTKILSFD